MNKNDNVENFHSTSTTVESLVCRKAIVAMVRRLVDELASSTADDDTLLSATALVEQAVHLLEKHPHQEGFVREVEGVLTGLGPIGELGPFTGELHVFAPAFDIEATGEGTDRKVAGVATYGDAYQGFPGQVQGGFIAATFDEVLGLAQAGFGRATADLQISYRRPAYLHRTLQYTAQFDRIDGRKAFVSGALHDGEILCAEAKALFIAPKTNA